MTTSVTSGMLYGTGDGMDGASYNDVPICCTPEFLSAYGVGLDTTLGDGVVSGVLREDQAEQQFMAMYQGTYDAGGFDQLQGLTAEIEAIVMDMSDDGVNVPEVMRQAGVQKLRNDGEIAENEGEPANPQNEDTVDRLALLLTDLEGAIAGTPLESMLTGFFGQTAIDNIDMNGNERDMLSGAGKLAYLMTRTVVSGYDVTDKNNEDEQESMDNDLNNGDGDRNGPDANISLLDKGQIGKQPRVSLGEIAQWSMETGAFMSLYGSAKGTDESVAQFTQRLFTAVSEGNTEELDIISGDSGMSHEQLQVLASVMMNNHANLMVTGGSYSTSAKNGAHEYLNNINGGDDQAFQMLHIGNVGAAGMNDDGIETNNDGFAAGNEAEGNDDLNQTASDVFGSGENGKTKTTIFNAGDNGQGSNGGFGDALHGDENETEMTDFGDTFDATATMTTVDPALEDFVFDDDTQSELLADLTDVGAADPDSTFPGGVIQVNGTDVEVSIENSEDFENEGYDVVVITLKDPTSGLVIGSMTATEAADETGAPKLVEYADLNGDGLVDDVDDSGLSMLTATTDVNGDGSIDDNDVEQEETALIYNEQDGEGSSAGMVDWEAMGTTMSEVTLDDGTVITVPDMPEGSLAMNEGEDDTGEWHHMFEDGALTTPDNVTANEGLISGWDSLDASIDFNETDTLSYGERNQIPYGLEAGIATIEVIIDSTGAEVDASMITIEYDELGNPELPTGYSYDERAMTADDIPVTSPAGGALAASGETEILVSASGNLLIGGLEYDPVSYLFVPETDEGYASSSPMDTTTGEEPAAGGTETPPAETETETVTPTAEEEAAAAGLTLNESGEWVDGSGAVYEYNDTTGMMEPV